MNKRFIVLFLITKDYKKVLMIKRNKKPFIGCWNGVGGKIEVGETLEQATIRECFEETNIKLDTVKHLCTIIYPNENIEGYVNNGTELNVMYGFTEKCYVESNYEGIYEWKPIEFAMDFYNEELAGLGNIAQIMKEIFLKEKINIL